jgi:hypothetical protein
VNSPGKAVLVPPRPNLGPESLPRELSALGLLAWVSIPVSAVIASIVLMRVIRQARLRERLRLKRAADLVSPADTFATRREQMAAWSASVRAVLAARFGAHWQARTTEEVASDSTLAETLGTEPAVELVRFLARADRAKFDDREGLQPPLSRSEVASPWLVEFVGSTAGPGRGEMTARSSVTSV